MGLQNDGKNSDRRNAILDDIRNQSSCPSGDWNDDLPHSHVRRPTKWRTDPSQPGPSWRSLWTSWGKDEEIQRQNGPSPQYKSEGKTVRSRRPHPMKGHPSHQRPHSRKIGPKLGRAIQSHRNPPTRHLLLGNHERKTTSLSMEYWTSQKILPLVRLDEIVPVNRDTSNKN